MVLLDEFVIDESLFSVYFSCNLAACKGACCVEGDAGAPLSGVAGAMSLWSTLKLVSEGLEGRCRRCKTGRRGHQFGYLLMC
jgi:hypothetical protein